MFITKMILKLFFSIALFIPSVVIAVHTQSHTTTGISGLIDAINTLVNQLIPLVLSLGLLVFLWGLVRFIFSSEDDKSHQAGRELMVWGIIALFVMVSVWGLVALINQITGVNQGGQGTLPLLNTSYR